MPIYLSSSDSEDDRHTRPTARMFSRQRPIHSVLGGGKVADVLLWKEPKISGGLLIGVMLIWFLFEVVDYNFVTLICHLSITAMLLAFIWCTGADFFNWKRPRIPEVLLHESSSKELASTIHRRINQILSKFLHVASGRDPALFFLTTISLYGLSVVGTYFSFVNLLFLGFLLLQTMPFLYDLYEDDTDHFVEKLGRKMRKMYRKFDSTVLNKIPRGPVKEKKRKQSIN